MKDSLTFLIKSAFVGAIISGVILLLVPDLRHGSSLNLSMFNPVRQTSDKLSFNHAVNVSGPAVVNIYSQSIESGSIYNRSQAVERTSLGSGVIMSEDGLILTCLHVIANANSILVGLQDGRRAEAQIIGYDPYTDLAVLKVAEDNLHVIPQLDDPGTRVGDLVLAIGNPYNLGQTITQGVVSRVGRNGLAAYFDFIQMDAVLNEGNSGDAICRLTIYRKHNVIRLNTAFISRTAWRHAGNQYTRAPINLCSAYTKLPSGNAPICDNFIHHFLGKPIRDSKRNTINFFYSALAVQCFEIGVINTD